MKTYRKLVSFTVLAMVAPASFSHAGEQVENAPPPFQQKREARLQELEEKLSLTPEQKAKIEAIWDKAGQQALERRKDGAAPRREQRREMRDAMKDAWAEVRAVLTPEQQKIFDAMPRPKPGAGKPRKQAPDQT